MFHFDLQGLLFRLLAFLAAMVIHEFAHAWVAHLWGDDTAKRNGRMTLNPMSHVDPLGLLLVLFGPFGWAKPVPVNPMHFRNKRFAFITVFLAGPGSNFLLAVVAGLLWKMFAGSIALMPGLEGLFVSNLLRMLFYINVVMGVFNLIPIPPLDGGRVVHLLVPRRYLGAWMQYETYGPFLLLLLVVIPPFQQGILVPLVQAGLNVIGALVGVA
jgi:Zn-dependent protease